VHKVKGFLLALQFLTRIRIGLKNSPQSEELTKATFYFPLVGFIIGLLLFFMAYLGKELFQFQPLTVAAMILATEIFITGGLHLDGFIDSCDGIFSGRESARILEIMRDSRVGAMGVLYLALLLLGKWALLYELLVVSQDPLPYYILILMPFVGRWAMTYVILAYPYARQEGLGQPFKQSLPKRTFLLISGYCVVLLLILTVPLRFSTALAPGMRSVGAWLTVALGLALLTCLGVKIGANRIHRRLGGHTGDTYGAINELTEVIFLGGFLFLSALLG
jgi:adenosylcobinamide-GDP ribazoletransferase